MKIIKEFSFLLFPYLLVSSALYHIAYWDVFDINGLAYIGVTDLIKSFVYPFLTFGYPFFIAIVSMELVFRFKQWVPFQSNNTIVNDGFIPSGGGRDTPVGRVVNSVPVVFALSVIWLLMVILLYKLGHVHRWLTWGALASLAPSIIFDRVGLFDSIISNNTIRQFVIRIVIYIPVFSFAAGKQDGELIHRNVQFKYFTIEKKDDWGDVESIDTLKVLGISDRYIFSADLRNTSILLMPCAEFDSLRIFKH